MKISHSKLTAPERKLISDWLQKRFSNKEIGRRLGRHPTTIANEIKKNSFGEGIYEPLHAQAKVEKRKQKAWVSKHPLKSPKVYAHVLGKLRDSWSPEQIAGRLKKDHPQDKSWHICHETIYQYIYSKNNKQKKLWEYLRRGQKKRKKKQGRKVQRSRIPDRISIHLRPKVIDQRKQIGHWEGDSIVGKRRTNGLHTEYERVSSLTRFERLKRISADETKEAMDKIFDPLPKKLKRSTTLDNGSEMAKHNQVDITVFFADPYSSWQRGGSENANLWIRYYFPKGTDFNQVSDEDLRAVEWELNNRPRKRLNYATPQEVFNNI